MAIRDIFRVNRKTFINPSAWIDYEGLKQQNKTIFTILKDTFSVPKPVRKESFHDAMKRQGLTEEDIKLAAISYRRYALLFVSLAFLTFIYAFYLLFRYWTFLGWALGLATTALFLSQAFKYDFWAYQLKKRKLGLTFKDWQRDVLGAKGPSS